MKINKKFPGKRVFITGAGSGLGRALSIEFAKKGWNIVVSDINIERIKETIKLVTEAGGKGYELKCDVTKSVELEKAAKFVEEKFNGIDILINNAGVSAGGYFEKIPLDKWEWILNLNLKSIINGCRSFIPIMEQQNYSHIVNIASSAGIASLPEMSSYNVTKAGAISLSETLRVELTPKNIGVSVVCPTFFKSNLMDEFISTDERQKIIAEKFFEKSKISSGKIARDTIKAIEKNKLYVISQLDGKFVWWAKRHAPELYFKIMGYFYKKGYFEKVLGI
jgi:short-subunit dehydrogenase